jgi:hypothetical protein
LNPPCPDRPTLPSAHHPAPQSHPQVSSLVPIPDVPAETSHQRRVQGNGFSVLSNLVAQAELRRRETAITGASATSPRLRIDPISLYRDLPLHVLQSAAAGAAQAGSSHAPSPTMPETAAASRRSVAAKRKGSASSPEAAPSPRADQAKAATEGPVSCVAHPYLRSVYFGDPCQLEPPAGGPAAPWLPPDQRGKEVEAEAFAARAPTLEQRHRLRQLALSEMKVGMEEQMKRVAMGLQAEQPLIVSLKAAAFNGSLAASHTRPTPGERDAKEAMRRVRGEAALLLERTLGEVGQLAVRERSREEEEAKQRTPTSPRVRYKDGESRVGTARTMPARGTADDTPVVLVLSPITRRRGSVSSGLVALPVPSPRRARGGEAAGEARVDKWGGDEGAASLAGEGSPGRGARARQAGHGRSPRGHVAEGLPSRGVGATVFPAVCGGRWEAGESGGAGSGSHEELPAISPRKASRFRLRPPGGAEAEHERGDDWRPGLLALPRLPRPGARHPDLAQAVS